MNQRECSVIIQNVKKEKKSVSVPATNQFSNVIFIYQQLNSLRSFTFFWGDSIATTSNLTLS